MFAHAVTTVSAARPHGPCTLVWFGLFSVLMVEVCAQTTPAAAVRGTPTSMPTPTGTAANSDATQPVELSPFEVRAEDDAGYQAANTTSGSRLNSSLRDTAAAIQPLTKEFLDDIGATDLDGLVGFANIEAELEDGSGFNAPTNRLATNNVSPFRIRGQGGGFAIDLAANGAPVDFSDIERVEISSGPNSILFGAGATGGLISMTTKRANLNRAQNSIRVQGGSEDRKRFEFDSNHILLKGKAAIRAWGLLANRHGWRYHDFEDTHRLNVGGTLRPFKRTSINFSYSQGELSRHVTQPYNAGDQLTLWRNLGSQTRDTTVGNTTTVTGLANLSTTDRFTFIQNGGEVFNLRNELTTRGLADNSENNKVLLSPSLSPFGYSLTGPGARFTSDFNNAIVRVEQSIGANFVLEAGWQRNEAKNTATNFVLATNMIELSGDPNLTSPRIDGTAVANPYVGRLYMETATFPDGAKIINEVARLTAAYTLKLGPWFGRHRLAALLENSLFDRNLTNGIEILVDQNNAPISAPATPDNVVNRIWRRNYVTEGDFRTYHFSDLRLPVPAVTSGANTLRSRVINRAGNNLITRDTDTVMFASQSYLLKERLVATFGYRTDKVRTFETGANRIAANDARVISGEYVANEFVLDSKTRARRDLSSITRTAGLVSHLTEGKRVSLYYNQSSNFGENRVGRTIYPKRFPPPLRGDGSDYGVMLDLLGDGKYFIRANKYTSDQLGDAALVPSGTAGDHYFSQSVIRVFNYLQGRGLVDAATADNERALSQFNAFSIDTASRGYEVDFTANPLPGFSLRAVFSYTNRGRENYFAEREPGLSQLITFWNSKDDGGLLANGNTIKQEIASLQSQIEDTIQSTSGGNNGSRPRKVSVTARYALQAGVMKGAFVGGSYNWAATPIQTTPVGQPNQFNGLNRTSLFGGYTFRLKSWKSQWRVQANVNNVFNADLADAGRWNTSGTGFRRYYLGTPRNFTVTTTVTF